MKAIVLAAGYATRLYPLTQDRPKALLEVGGRPVLSWILDRVLAIEEVDEVVLVTNARFEDAFQAWSAAIDARVCVRVVSDGSTEPEGRLGAIQDLSLGMVFIADVEADFLVVAGDNLIEFDLAPHARYFREVRRPLVLLRRIEGGVPPGKYNEVLLDERGDVARMREKPADPEGDLSALCLYFLPADVRADLGVFLRTEDEKDAPGHFLAWLAARRKVAASPVRGAVHDIGDRESLEAARAAFAAREGAR